MQLKSLEITGFKSFAKKTYFLFDAPITSIVGPNGSGKSNVAEAFRWVLGEQSMKSLRGKRGEDLIFNGAALGQKLSRAAVTITFDNSDRRLPIDYDEVVITREVFRDGTNDYAINGSKVRLRDIIELLSNVSLGTSGHHIISQGEADRLLLANMFDRREMIEEALGLKVYQWKIAESEKKFEKTQVNIKEVESLRREIAPHIKFLQKQVEKIEKTDELRRELKSLYLQYLKKESIYLAVIEQKLVESKEPLTVELAAVESRLTELSQETRSSDEGDGLSRSLAEVDQKLRELRAGRDELGRKLGRLEGMIEIKGERLGHSEDNDNRMVRFGEVEQLTRDIETGLEQAATEDNLGRVREVFSQLRERIKNFLLEHSGSHDLAALELEVENLKKEKLEAEKEVMSLGDREGELLREQDSLRTKLEVAREKTRGAERELFELKSRRGELRSQLEAVAAHEETFRTEGLAFKREVEEGVILVDREILKYEGENIGDYEPIADREGQENLRRRIERIKIRLEDMGVEGTDVLEEYKEVTSRDEFLAKELIDLKQSEESLEKVMIDLKQKINMEFKAGLDKINHEFQNYFALMFGGGTAKLEVVTPEKKKRRSGTELDLGTLEDNLLPETSEEEGVREGVDIAVNLPRKKIRSLEMLSGGERALTSIALLFAMSQVNPPPFLILDETDAALDESNSRKYGDMIENLGKHSQLIVITHNRETMSRASILYGVTMGSDAVSKLISLRFDEAEAYAK